jgi:CBS domain containing-hemolysin-like protein
MWDLILAVGLAVLISALCSVAEAVLYSIPWSSIEHLRKEGKASGKLLYELRLNVQKPITAILTLNTIANTAGAAVAGASAARIFGPDALVWFSALFTVLILLFSEILPKTLGVMYARKLGPVIAKPLKALVIVMLPAIAVLGLLARLVERKKKGPHASEEDILAMVSLTRRAGSIKPFEETFIQNVLLLDTKTVHEIMTPRTVVFSLPASMSVGKAVKGNTPPHSRIPVFDHDDPEDVVGIAMRRDILEAAANDRHETTLAELMKPVRFIQETLTLDKLLITFLESQTHLFVVLDEYGGLAGIVSLEDVLEEILGKEIVDETDEVVDMRALARQRRKALTTKERVPVDSSVS